MWRILRTYLLSTYVLAADVTIEADGVVNSVKSGPRRTAPVLLQAKATLKRPDPEKVKAVDKLAEKEGDLPLSFFQEESSSGSGASTAPDEFLTEVLPMAAPNLPMPQTQVPLTTGAAMSPVSFQLLSVLLVLLVAMVFYSASVSHPRHDEIRQPPVAFSTKQTNFSLELQD
eukprot:Skav233138  [mRNA]  locus=scaffold792:235811:239794:+ [translate_table: standard]